MSTLPGSAWVYRTARFLFLASLLAVAAQEVVADVTQFDCSLITPNIPDQFPAWDDSVSGFGDAPYYTTIQTADIDGDGQAELLARGKAGILVSHFDKPSGVWIARKPGPALSDASGWNTPDVYLTIQAADIDNDRQAEVIARAHDGIHVYHYAPASDSWTELSPASGVTRPFPDSDSTTGGTDWTQAAYYSIIQLADIDGDGAAELLGRGTWGMVAYHWDKVTQTWQALGTTGFSADTPGPYDDSNGWNDIQYYSTIQTANIDGDSNGQAELLGRSKDGMQTLRWNVTSKNWDPLGDIGPFGANWNDAAYYSTIQLADIDGDKQAELLARSSLGMVTYHWDKTNSSWGAPLGGYGPFGDGNGFGDPSYYVTLQLANIDGDSNGRMELLGRGATGIYAYSWNTAENAWVPLSSSQATSPPWSDATGWNVVSSYSTIQAADVDGNGAAELIGKSDAGVTTWQYTGKDGIFTSTMVNGFPALSGSQQAAYQYLSRNASQELVGVTDDIRGQYNNTLNQHGDWRAARDVLRALPAAPPAGTGISQDDWTAVVSQLSTEVGYVRLAYVWFDNLTELFTQIAILENAGGGTVGFVAGYLNLPSDDSSSTILNYISLALQFIGAIVGIIPGVGEAAGIVASVAGLATTAIATSQAASGGPASIQIQVQQLEAKLIDAQTQAQASNVCLKKAFVSSYGLLNALAKPISSLSVAWDDTLNASMAAAGRRGYELNVWQTLALANNKWEVGTNYADGGPDCSRNSGEGPFPYPAGPDGISYRYILPGGNDNQNAYLIADQNCGTAPAQAALDRLFLPPNTDGFTGNLGVPKADVHCGYNGWSLAGSLGFGGCNQFLGSDATDSERKLALKQQVQQVRARKAFATHKIKALMGEVRRTVPARGQAKRTLQAALIQPLQGALRSVNRTRPGTEATHTTAAVQQLHLFTMRLRAHGAQINAQTAAGHSAKAHLIRAKLKEIDLPQILAAIPASKR